MLAESRVLSANIVSRLLRHEVTSGTGRFELHWDLAQDPDVAPETALLVVGCAQALARYTNGAVLVEGAIVNRDAEYSFGQAYSLLFKAHVAPVDPAEGQVRQRCEQADPTSNRRELSPKDRAEGRGGAEIARAA